MARRPDLATLVAGLLVAGFGVILLLDAESDLDFGFAALGPIAAFICGATLLASGLSRRG
jgi:hypothetical protein